MTRCTWSTDIPGDPVGKGRPRASIVGHARFRMRTPEKTAKWEAYAAAWMAQKWSGDALRCPVTVSIKAVFARPKSKMWKTKPTPRLPHTARPDADNVAKAVCDSLEKAGILHNDSQACRLTISKWVASGHEQPHVSVTVAWEE